jgi:hypothetical protein
LSVAQLTVDFAARFATDPPREAPPQRVVAALAQLSLYRMHERSLHDVESGDADRATRRLEALAGRLEGAGEAALARTAQTEADRLRRTGVLSEQGRKQLKYGTRALIALPLTTPRLGSP